MTKARKRLKLRTTYAITAALLAVTASGTRLSAQQTPIGSVSTNDAEVTGGMFNSPERAMLVGNGTVTARDRVAFVQLVRGGTVAVCATSGLHLTSGAPPAAPATAASTTPDASPAAPGTAAASATGDASSTAPAPAEPVSGTTSAQSITTASLPPLMLALDRGAVEMKMQTINGDILMTPDLRFEFSEEGGLDLRVRVGRNGDTCVENRVSGLGTHPSLKIASLFGGETYTVMPGQHVLFEHASLREVVDNESSPCGCPEAPAVPPPPALGGLTLPTSAKPQAAQAVVEHPFPTAVSQGLAPPPEVPQAPPGVVHTQIATTLTYSGGGPQGEAKPATTADPAAPKKGFFHSIGRFFKHAF